MRRAYNHPRIGLRHVRDFILEEANVLEKWGMGTDQFYKRVTEAITNGCQIVARLGDVQRKGARKGAQKMTHFLQDSDGRRHSILSFEAPGRPWIFCTDWQKETLNDGSHYGRFFKIVQGWIPYMNKFATAAGRPRASTPSSTSAKLCTQCMVVLDGEQHLLKSWSSSS